MAIINDEKAKERLETSPLKKLKDSKEVKESKECCTYPSYIIREDSETKD